MPIEKRWVVKPQGDSEAVAKLAAVLRISPVLANLLVQRGIDTVEKADKFFKPSLADLHDPFLMKDMDKAVERVEQAVRNNEKIMVYGDYDVDGCTAVALVYKFLRQIGHKNLMFYIPDRYTEGYGISVKGIDLAARKGVGEGVLAGACAGVALDLASGEQPYYSMVFALAGLACGLCKGTRKIVAALVYVLTCFVAVLWSWDGGLHVGLPMEAVVGAIVFLVLPVRPKKEQALPAAPGAGRGPDLESSRQAISRKMGEMASAFHALYDTVQETLHPESANTENPAEIFTSTADKVCAKCVLRTTCWQKEYQDTRRAFNDATGPILERGRALATDFSGQFSARCVHFPELLGEVNRQLTAFLRRRQALRRTWQTRSALCSQYARLDKFMRSAATELSTGLTPDLPRQEKLDGFLRSMNLSGGVVYYDKEGRLRVEVPAAEELKTRSARRELAEILGTPLREGEEENNRILFAQAEPFRATAALAGAPRQGEPVSGDTGIWFRREDGMLFLLLCDGMGSGPGAKQESAQAAKLIERFLRAGMDPAEAVETVSSALSLRGEAGGSTTIDLLSVDLFTGRCCVHKQGARFRAAR